MLNNTGIVKETYNDVPQILFNVELQASVGVLVDQDAGTEDEATGKKIVKAGTPLTGSLDARTTAFTAASAGSSGVASDAVGILLHDVDVTVSDANGTLLIFGFVNTDRIDATAKAKLTEYVKAALPLITFAAMDS